MRQAADKYIVRFPEGMRDRIRENATANRRSMNAEIIHCLDRAIEAQDLRGSDVAITLAVEHGQARQRSSEKIDG